MVYLTYSAQDWLNKISENIVVYNTHRFFDKVKECCDYPLLVRDDLSELIKDARKPENSANLSLYREKLKTMSDPRATLELFLMGHKYNSHYPSDEASIESARNAFCEHISRPLNDLQRELLSDMVRNDSFDGDFAYRALLPVVDRAFERFIAPRVEDAEDSLEKYLARPDYEGDYYDQLNVIMYQERIKELKDLLRAIRERKKE